MTLAFTPYGADPGKLAERARAQRHEILLQIPMEPFDYPDNDPGPQTLLATLGPEAKSRPAVLAPQPAAGLCRHRQFHGRALRRDRRRDAADHSRSGQARTVGYFDDGSAPRSVAAALAGGQAMPFAKADVTIDAVPTSAEIDRTLAKLEALAKERGVAVGIASALPISIERIGAWIKTLDSRGIMLVPLTTAMLKSKSS